MERNQNSMIVTVTNGKASTSFTSSNQHFQMLSREEIRRHEFHCLCRIGKHLQTRFCSLILNLSKSWIWSSFPYYTSARCGNKGSRVFRGGAIVWLPQLLYKPNHNTCKHVLKPIVRIMDMGRQCSFLHSV